MSYRLVLTIALGAASLSACIDIRDYAGNWRGEVVAEKAVRQGFAEHTSIAPLQLEEITLESLSGHLSTSDGRFDSTRLVGITKATADDLANISLGAGSLRTFLTYAPIQPSIAETELTSGNGPQPPALIIVSLFSDDRVQLRIIRGNDLYGVFHLKRE